MSIEVQAIFTVVNSVDMMIAWRQRREVPHIASMLSKLNIVDGSYLCRKLMIFNVFLRHAKVLIVF